MPPGMLAQKPRFAAHHVCVREYALDVRVVLGQNAVLQKAGHLFLAKAENFGDLAECGAALHVVDRADHGHAVAAPRIDKVVERRVALVPAEIEIGIGQACPFFVKKPLEVEVVTHRVQIACAYVVKRDAVCGRPAHERAVVRFSKPSAIAAVCPVAHLLYHKEV